MYTRRRTIVIILALIATAWTAAVQLELQPQISVPSSELGSQYFDGESPIQALNSLEVKGRAPKTGYSRDQFGNGWLTQGACDTRNRILSRDLSATTIDDACRVQQGTLNDPYTGETILFERGPETSQKVQIDHVVALSDAWQKGAQNLTGAERVNLANDPLNLLAVSGAANQQKSDGDAATWIPSNKPFRCQYVARQVAVKKKYRLWVTQAEKEAIERILKSCSVA